VSSALQLREHEIEGRIIKANEPTVKLALKLRWPALDLAPPLPQRRACSSAALLRRAFPRTLPLRRLLTWRERLQSDPPQWRGYRALYAFKKTLRRKELMSSLGKLTRERAGAWTCACGGPCAGGWPVGVDRRV